MAWIDERMAFCDLFRADKFLIKPHVARFGAFAFEIIIPCFVRGKVKPARHMKPDRMARGFFNLFIKINRVTLKPADVWVT